MSSPKFMVVKLKDLRIPVLILLIAVILFVFLLFRNKSNVTQTFSTSDTYQDGKYIAGILLSDAEMDLIVEVKNHEITSISLSGLDESSSFLYQDLISGIDYVNTYVTATQSLELPQTTNTSSATLMLMDAVKVALSEETTPLSATYQKADLTPTNLYEEIWVDEFDQSADLDDATLSSEDVSIEGIIPEETQQETTVQEIPVE